MPSTLTGDEDLPANMSPEELDKLRKDLDFMMAHYEGELKKPIRNLVSGRLPRTLLIQVALPRTHHPFPLHPPSLRVSLPALLVGLISNREAL